MRSTRPLPIPVGVCAGISFSWRASGLPQLDELGSRYHARLDRLRSCVARVEHIYTVGDLQISDCELVYESTFLAAIGHLEGTIGQLFEEFIWRSQSRTAGLYSLARVKSRDALRGLVQ